MSRSRLRYIRAASEADVRSETDRTDGSRSANGRQGQGRIARETQRSQGNAGAVQERPGPSRRLSLEATKVLLVLTECPICAWRRKPSRTAQIAMTCCRHRALSRSTWMKKGRIRRPSRKPQLSGRGSSRRRTSSQTGSDGSKRVTESLCRRRMSVRPSCATCEGSETCSNIRGIR